MAVGSLPRGLSGIMVNIVDSAPTESRFLSYTQIKDKTQGQTCRSTDFIRVTSGVELP
jgi:hypothetical protein